MSKSADNPFKAGQNPDVLLDTRNSGGRSEVERLAGLMTGRPGRTGARLGCLLLPLLLIAAAIIGGFTFLYSSSPERAVELANQKFDSQDTKRQIEAIKEYQTLLQRKSPIDPARFWVIDDRDTLYRRIVVHEFKFQKNEGKASEWILKAWDEGIRDLRIQEPEVKAFWEETVEALKRKALIKDKNR